MTEDRRMTTPQLREFICEHTASLPNNVSSDIVDKVTEELLTDPDSRTHRGPISKELGGDNYYVVPGDDLNFAESSVGIAAGLAVVLKDPVTLLGSLCLLLLQFRRKAVKLTREEGLIVLTLIDRRWRDDGLTVEELTRKLPPELDLLTENVEAALKNLKNTRRRGELTPVVREWNERWYANEIW